MFSGVQPSHTRCGGAAVPSIMHPALKALADEGTITIEKVAEAIDRYGIDTDKPNPTTV
jgi:pyruvate dehydrogenase complex dehydrogenase (E1) component